MLQCEGNLLVHLCDVHSICERDAGARNACVINQVHTGDLSFTNTPLPRYQNCTIAIRVISLSQKISCQIVFAEKPDNVRQYMNRSSLTDVFSEFSGNFPFFEM